LYYRLQKSHPVWKLINDSDQVNCANMISEIIFYFPLLGKGRSNQLVWHRKQKTNTHTHSHTHTHE